MITITKADESAYCSFCRSEETTIAFEGEKCIVSICAACLKDLKAALDKQPPTISDEQRAELYEKFYPQTQPQLDAQIDDALNHVAVKKAVNKFRYVQGWLRRNCEKNGAAYGGKATESRDVAKYHQWPNRRLP